MTTLVIAAHPDDEVLGCGGTIAKLAGEGEEVHILILGEGITSRYTDRADAQQSELDALRQDARRAAKILGASSVRQVTFPDNQFDTVPLLEIVKTLEDAVEELRPSTVYTQHGGDLNIDHEITFRATLTATRRVEGHPVETVHAYSMPSSTEWAHQSFEPIFRPNFFVDIGQTLETKIQAMSCYESESRPFPHPRSAEVLRAMALVWGSTAGLPAAEPFHTIRAIRR